MQQNFDQITTSMERMETDIDLSQDRLEYLCTKRDRVEKEVEHIMGSLQDVLQQKKEQLLKKVNELYSSEKQKLQTGRDKKTMVTETKTGLSKKSDSKPSNSKDGTSELGRSNKGESRLVDLRLNVNVSELMHASGKLPFGEVDAVYNVGGVAVTTRCLPTPSSLPSPSPSQLSSSDCDWNASAVCTAYTNAIKSRVEEDKVPPKLNDIAVVKVGEIVAVVVTDRSNKCIKSFYTRGDMSLYSTYSSASPPRGIARVGNSKVGVTCPESGDIKIIKVTPVLIRDKLIKTTKQYRGIAMLDEKKIVVSTYEINPGSVDIIDYKGNVLRSLRTDRNGDNLFEAPLYVCATPERHIIVSDCEKHVITCFTENGKVIFRYGEGGEVTLGYPLGIALDSYGDILVADCDNHKVVKILEDGQGAKEYLRKEDGILGPYSVDVDASGIVYVIEWNGNIKSFDKD